MSELERSTQAGRPSPKHETANSEPDPRMAQRSTFRTILFIGLAAMAIVAILNLWVYVRTGQWQMLALALGELVAIACVGIAFHRLSQNRFDEAGYWALAAAGFAFGVAELFHSGSTPYFLTGSILLTILVGSIMLPNKRRAWLVAAVIFMAYFGLIYWLDEVAHLLPFVRFHISEAPLLGTAGPAIVVVLIVLIAWQLFRAYRNINTIRTRLLTAAVSLVIVPVLATAGSGVLASLQSGQQQVVNQLTSVAMLKEAEVNSWLQSLRNFLEFVLSDQEVATVRALTREPPTSLEHQTASIQLRTRFRQVLVQSPIFDEVYMLDAGGQVLLSTDPSREGLIDADKRYFQEGLKGLWVNPPFRETATGEATVVVARPISDIDGRAMAVLVGRASLSTLQKLMQEKAGLGTRAETYLVGEDYILLTDSRNPTYISGQGIVRTDGTAEAIGKQHSGSFAGPYKNYLGVPVLGAYRWMPELRVALLAEQEQAEALGGTYRTLFLIGGLALVFLAAAVVVALLLSRSIADPIANLAQTARQIAAGDLALTARVERQDEVGTLARTFNGMTEQLRGLISGLEQRVADRTREVERRAGQIAAGAEISRIASQELDPERLLRTVADLIAERFQLYYAAVFLVDESGEQAVLHAGTGEAGRAMMERGHKLAVGGSSMVGWACAHKQARIALDVGEEAVRFANPLLPLTRSEMALPLRVGDRVIGALDIQSTQAQAFDKDDITALQGMADQIAVALENARLFQQSQSSLREIERVNRLLTQRGWETFLRSARADFAEFHQPGVASLTSQEVEKLTQQRSLTDQDGAASIPLRVRGQVIGTLVVERAADRTEWSATELGLLEEMAAQSAQALESARLFEEPQRLAAQERLTGAITARMRESLDMERVLQTAADEMFQALGLDEIAIRLTPEETTAD